MIRLLHAIVVLLGVIKHGESQSEFSLTTQFDGPNNDAFADSDKFSILTGDTAVSIERFDIHMTATTQNVQVWTKLGYPVWWDDGTYTKVWEGTIVGQGQGVATPLPAFSSPIELAANSILGVFLLVDAFQSNQLYHSTGTLGDKEVFATDGTISITEGISQWYYHANFQHPTRWNGVLYYSIPAPEPTSSPTISMMPSNIPSSAQPSVSVMPSQNPSLASSSVPSSSASPSQQPSLVSSSTPSQTPSLTLSNAPSLSDPEKSPSSSVCQYVSECCFYCYCQCCHVISATTNSILSLNNSHLHTPRYNPQQSLSIRIGHRLVNLICQA